MSEDSLVVLPDEPKEKEGEPVDDEMYKKLIAKAVPLVLSAVIGFFSTTMTHKVEDAKEEASHQENKTGVQEVKAAIDAERDARKKEREDAKRARDEQIRKLEDRILKLETLYESEIQRRRDIH